MAIKKFRVYVDMANRYYSKPMDAESMEELLEKFKEQGLQLYDDFEAVDDVYEEPLLTSYGVEEMTYADEEAVDDNDYEIEDSIHVKN